MKITSYTQFLTKSKGTAYLTSICNTWQYLSKSVLARFFPMRSDIFLFASTSVAAAAPRLRASMEKEPEPAKRSRIDRPSTLPSMLKSASLTLDDVYRATAPGRTVIDIPLSLPPVMRIVAIGPIRKGPSLRPLFFSCPLSHGQRGTVTSGSYPRRSASVPRYSVPAWSCGGGETRSRPPVPRC